MTYLPALRIRIQRDRQSPHRTRVTAHVPRTGVAVGELQIAAFTLSATVGHDDLVVLTLAGESVRIEDAPESDE